MGDFLPCYLIMTLYKPSQQNFLSTLSVGNQSEAMCESRGSNFKIRIRGSSSRCVKIFYRHQRIRRISSPQWRSGSQFEGHPQTFQNLHQHLVDPKQGQNCRSYWAYCRWWVKWQCQRLLLKIQKDIFKF